MRRFNTQSPAAVHQSHLEKLYGLTPAEAELAVAFRSESSIEVAARCEGLTTGTARQYMKRIFKKTGTSNQAQLMKVLVQQIG